MVHVNALHGPACRQCRASWPVIIASSCSCIVQASYKPSPTFTHRSHKVHEDHEAGAAVEYKNIQPTFCVQSKLPQFWYRYFWFCDKCTILNTWILVLSQFKNLHIKLLSIFLASWGYLSRWWCWWWACWLRGTAPPLPCCRWCRCCRTCLWRAWRWCQWWPLNPWWWIWVSRN